MSTKVAGEPAWALFEAFLAVMSTGSLSGAARALRVAQPTVRRHVQELEDTLGVVLFTRGRNGLQPTELAHATLPHAEAIAAGTRAFVRAVSAPADAARGTVRVTCSEIVGAEVLPAILVELRRHHPDIAVELVLDNRNQDLLRRDADIAVRMIEPTQAALVRRKAARIEVGLFAAPSYLASRTRPRRIAELGGHALVGPDRARAALDVLGRLGLPTQARAYALRCDSDLAQLAAVRAGLGIGVCQVPLARRAVELTRVADDFAIHLDAWVTMHEDLRGVMRMRLVFDHLVEALAGYVGTGRRPRARRDQRVREG